MSGSPGNTAATGSHTEALETHIEAAASHIVAVTAHIAATTETDHMHTFEPTANATHLKKGKALFNNKSR